MVPEGIQVCSGRLRRSGGLVNQQARSSPEAWCMSGKRVIFFSCQALSAGVSLVGTSSGVGPESGTAVITGAFEDVEDPAGQFRQVCDVRKRWPRRPHLASAAADEKRPGGESVARAQQIVARRIVYPQVAAARNWPAGSALARHRSFGRHPPPHSGRPLSPTETSHRWKST
jgi:hypothetical protein